MVTCQAIGKIITKEKRKLNKGQIKAILRSMDAPKIFSQIQVRKAMIGELVGTIGTTFSYSASAADGVINSLAIAFIADEQKD